MQVKRVLIVEDDLASRRVLRSFFMRHGWVVTEAGTVAEGLASLDPPPDSLILDLRLPDGHGDAVLRKLREDGVPIPVVLVTTGISDPLWWMEVAKLRPDLLLQKPIDVDVLFRLSQGKVSN
jgi:DNA-binding response OmpR family regulator